MLSLETTCVSKITIMNFLQLLELEINDWFLRLFKLSKLVILYWKPE